MLQCQECSSGNSLGPSILGFFQETDIYIYIFFSDIEERNIRNIIFVSSHTFFLLMI